MLDFWKRVEKELIELEHPRSWLSEVTDISTSTITTWVNDDRYPQLDKAIQIASALGVSLDYLSTGKLPEEKDPDLRDICHRLRNFDHDRLMMIKGMVAMVDMMELSPKLLSQAVFPAPVAIPANQERAAGG